MNYEKIFLECLETLKSMYPDGYDNNLTWQKEFSDLLEIYDINELDIKELLVKTTSKFVIDPKHKKIMSQTLGVAVVLYNLAAYYSEEKSSFCCVKLIKVF